MKHLADHLIIGKKLELNEYKKYQYVTTNQWGEPAKVDLDETLTYYALKIDKNRGGNKDRIPVIITDLDRNIWRECGYLVLKPKRVKEEE